MDFFHLSTMGTMDDELVLLDHAPEGIGLYSHTLSRGRHATPHYPEGAKIFLSKDYPGIKLTSLLGNTKNYLIVSMALREVIAAHCPDIEVEYLAFDLHDHRKRLYSSDYVIVNPIGTFECLDEVASGFEYNEDGDLIGIERHVLDRNKVEDAPSLFRMGKAPSEYVVDEELAAAMSEGGFTNVVLDKLPFSG